MAHLRHKQKQNSSGDLKWRRKGMFLVMGNKCNVKYEKGGMMAERYDAGLSEKKKKNLCSSKAK